MNFLLIGRPGSGKTTAACTAPPPIGLIDLDAKADQMANIHPMVLDGRIEIIKVRAKLVDDTLQYRALYPEKGPKEQPKGYVEAVTILNDIIDENEKYQKYNTIVLDSLTRLTEHLKRLLIHHRTNNKFGKWKGEKATEDMNWPSWGSYLSNMEELFTGITGYLEDKHFVCCVHEKEMIKKDPITETEYSEGFKPLIDGQMRDKLAGYFNEVYYMDVFESRKDKIKEYRFRTSGAKYDSRTSLKLNEFESADLGRIIKMAGG